MGEQERTESDSGKRAADGTMRKTIRFSAHDVLRLSAADSPAGLFQSPRPKSIKATAPKVPPRITLNRRTEEGPRLRIAKIGAAQAQEKKRTIATSDRYELLESIGRGGRSKVFRARDRVLGHLVTLKFLPPHLQEDPEAAEAFKQEARIVMQLTHQNIVKIHNLEVYQDNLYIVMEHIDGLDFSDILKQMGRLTLGSVLQIARSCAEALDYAHRHEVLHKDLKPANLMLNQESVLKIVDFGIAGFLAEESENDGSFLEGTFPYLSPEQLQGLPLDARADVYSLAAVFYELLSGRLIFPRDTPPEDSLTMDPEPIASMPLLAWDVLCRALAKNPDDRWNTAGEFCQALEAAAANS